MTFNSELSTEGFRPRGWNGIAPARFLVDGTHGRVLFAVSELGQGNTDLNGDGSSDDFVLHVYDLARGAINVGKAVDPADVDGDGRRSAFTVSESGVHSDLNGDGDVKDWVLHVYDSARGELVNLRLATLQRSLAIDGPTVAFSVVERDQGNRDLNGDGDASDAVVYLYDTSTRRVFNSRRAFFWDAYHDRPVVDRRRVAFRAVHDQANIPTLHFAKIFGPPALQGSR
jgi:hypothetical protein